MSTTNRTARWLALTLAMVFPSLLTWVYFVWLHDSRSQWQQVAFGIGKFLQFFLPVIFVLWFRREKLNRGRLARPPADATNIYEGQQPSVPKNWNGTLLGIVFGLAVVIAIFAIFFIFLPHPTRSQLTGAVRDRILSLGIDNLWKYVGLSVFYAAVHSFLEEYYWRWYVFDELRSFFSETVSNLFSSLGFMAHHVIVLACFLGWQSPLTYLFSLGVASGGIAWAWLYGRDGHLRNAWLSHAIVDAGIFGLGFVLVRQTL